MMQDWGSRRHVLAPAVSAYPHGLPDAKTHYDVSDDNDPDKRGRDLCHAFAHRRCCKHRSPGNGAAGDQENRGGHAVCLPVYCKSCKEQYYREAA